MFIHIYAPPVAPEKKPDMRERVEAVEAASRRGVAAQGPQDPYLTVSAFNAVMQNAYPSRNPEAEGTSNRMIQAIFWQAGGFFDSDPDVNQQKLEAAIAAAAAEFENYEFAAWGGMMNGFSIALPKEDEEG